MSSPARQRENRRLRVRLCVVALAMFGFGYALVPFYDAICSALGVNDFVKADAPLASTQVDASRTVTVELDANAHDLPWRFRPLVRHITVHPGELARVEFEIANVRGTPVTGQAVPSYGPARAAEHLRKIECFCFTQQTLAAGETRRMPVAFVVDPKLPQDVSTITLSYTFFEVAGRGGKS
ncbi:MAG: cytochrome c oxidase assembly protein [Burkholderiales bacterium]